MVNSWSRADKVDEYVERVETLAPRQAGERELIDALPSAVGSLLDLGCGNARLASLAARRHPEITTIVATDTSEPMLALARAALGSNPGATVLRHDLNDSVLPLGVFDAVISGFAIHHVEDRRKRELFREIAQALPPGGVFANLEVVRCATPELHAEFYRRIGRTGDDPDDVLATVESQLAWMRDAGLDHVDCQWRWRGFALLVGTRA